MNEILTVECPYCGASIGDNCSNGKSLAPSHSHNARRRALEDSLSVQDKDVPLASKGQVWPDPYSTGNPPTSNVKLPHPIDDKYDVAVLQFTMSEYDLGHARELVRKITDCADIFPGAWHEYWKFNTNTQKWTVILSKDE